MAIIDVLDEAQFTFNERSKKYGDTYKDQGRITNEIFGKITLKTASDSKRYGIMGAMLIKYMRYAEGFSNHKDHRDDLIDLICYTAMLMEISDEEANTSNTKHISK